MIERMAETGTHPSLEKMRAEVPEGVLEMLSIPGLRPEKIMKIFKELGTATLAELEDAAKDDRIRKVKGLGAALQRKILQGFEIRRQSHGARHVHRAEELITTAVESLKRSGLQLTKITPAGDFRRGNELVKNLALVAQTGRAAGGLKTFGELKITLTDAKHYGSGLLFATGSKEHLTELKAYALSEGCELTEEGLFKGGKLVASKSEADIYKALRLQFIPPELREARCEISAARAGKIPQLVEPTDIRGILHAHTTASDGSASLEEMAEAARQRGYQYLGVSDHSQSAHYAGGLKVEEIEAQHAGVDRLNRRYGDEFRILKGIESDILPDGSLDYPAEVLRRFDFIIASVHGQFRLDRTAQTQRYCGRLKTRR